MTRPRRYDAPVVCHTCQRAVGEAHGCATDRVIRYDTGETNEPIPYGEESIWSWDKFEGQPVEPCRDCGVMPGEYHHAAHCSVEECPRCHDQYANCSCVTLEKVGPSPRGSRR